MPQQTTDSWNGRRAYCFRCGHQWTVRTEERPRSCPGCRSARYDYPDGKGFTCTSCGTVWYPKDADDRCPGCGRGIIDAPEQRKYHCNQCGHDWVSRAEGRPVRCPSCRSRNWDEEKAKQFTCRKCGYVWNSNLERPKKCPSCKSYTWDSDTFKLKCFRCGYKWVLSKGADPDSVKTCPSCRSRRWNELPRAVVCFRCGSLFVPRKNESICPSCSGSPGPKERRCGFCDTSWMTTGDGRSICPRCGLIVSDDDASERLIQLYGKDGYRLNYLFKDGVGCVYLWKDSFPVACEYMDRLIDSMRIRFETFIGRVGSPMHEQFWDSVIARMLEGKDSYMENIPYFVERLGLNRRQAEILALHFVGMSPEVISLRFDTSLKDIRSEFTRIQEAFSRSGIVVNDSVYTEDPISCYGDHERI